MAEEKNVLVLHFPDPSKAFQALSADMANNITSFPFELPVGAIIADYTATLGAGAAEKTRLFCAIAGVAGTLGACMISRVRQRAPKLDF